MVLDAMSEPVIVAAAIWPAVMVPAAIWVAVMVPAAIWVAVMVPVAILVAVTAPAASATGEAIRSDLVAQGRRHWRSPRRTSSRTTSTSMFTSPDWPR